MWDHTRGLATVNGVTLLLGFLVVMIVVMGGYTASTPREAVSQARTPDEGQAFVVDVAPDVVTIRNHDATPNVYDQLTIYVSAESGSQQLAVEEEYAVTDDGDSLFERRETVRIPLNGTLSEGTPATVKVVDAGQGGILYTTTTNVTATED